MIDIKLDNNLDVIIDSTGDFGLIGSKTDNTNIEEIIIQDLIIRIKNNEKYLIQSQTQEEVASKLISFWKDDERIQSIDISYDLDKQEFFIGNLIVSEEYK